MKKLRFILLCITISVMTAGLTGCTKSVYDEKAALEAQQGLLQFKYDQEIKLELLRQAGQTSYLNTQYTLQYNFSTRISMFNDSLSRVNQDTWNNYYYKKRDIVVQVLDLVTDEPVAGVEVTIPTSTGSVVKALTDSSGNAKFSPNGNIPRPASAIATKAGYASGSVFATINGDYATTGTATIRIWNQTNTPNTIKGKIYVENDLTNDEPELAKNAFVNAFTYVNVKGYNQRFDWTAVTDANGEYSIKLPNLLNNLQIAHNTYDGAIKMYVNGEVPGYDSIPKVKNVAASFYLGLVTSVTFAKGVSYGTSAIENATNSLYSIPTNINRYSVSAAADSNGRGHYITGLNFNRIVLNSSTVSDSATMVGAPYTLGVGDLTSAAYYSTNTITPSIAYSSVYLAGTTLKDTIPATFYDLLENADGYWKSLPEIKIVLTQATNVFGNKYKYISEVIQTKGGRIAKPDVNVTYSTVLINRVKNIGSITSTTYNARDINAGFTSIGGFTNGITKTYNFTYGCGKIQTAVR